MIKKVIGYELKSSKFKKPASLILFGNDGWTGMNPPIQDGDGGREAKLREYGVLDLWFNPVYEDINKFKIGDWVTKKWKYGGLDVFKVSNVDGEKLCSTQYYRKGKGRKNYEFIPSVCSGQCADVTYSRYELRLSTPEEIEEATKIKIGKYDVEIKSNGVKIGCSSYSLQNIKDCEKVLKLSNASFIDFNGNKLTSEIVKRILEFYF